MGARAELTAVGHWHSSLAEFGNYEGAYNDIPDDTPIMLTVFTCGSTNESHTLAYAVLGSNKNFTWGSPKDWTFKLEEDSKRQEVIDKLQHEVDNYRFDWKDGIKALDALGALGWRFFFDPHY